MAANGAPLTFRPTRQKSVDRTDSRRSTLAPGTALLAPLRPLPDSGPGASCGWRAAIRTEGCGYPLDHLVGAGEQGGGTVGLSTFAGRPRTHRIRAQPPRSPSSLLAAARRYGGSVRPSELAVLRFTTSSKFAGCSTGISSGFAPFRIELI